jgi:hypothetical protein
VAAGLIAVAVLLVVALSARRPAPRPEPVAAPPRVLEPAA